MLDAETMRLVDQSFHAVAWLYGAAAFFALLSTFRASQGLRWLPRTLLWMGWGVHTLALAGQWRAGGAAHPPFTNLYETLLFFPWTLVSAQLLLGQFSTEFFSALTAAIGMGLAWVQVNPGLSPVPAELRSLWLLGHSAFGFFAYSCFLVSLFLSVIFAVRDEVPPETVAIFPAALGAAVTAPILYIGSPKVVHVIVVTACGLSAAYVLLGLIVWAALRPRSASPRKSASAKGVPAGFLGGPDEKIHWSRRILRSLQLAAVLGLLAVVVATAAAGAKNPALSLHRSPYRTAALAFVLLVNLFFTVLFRKRSNLEAKLPVAGDVDRAGYKSAALGFSLLSASLLTGAIWAYESWGSYWSWEPKEIWALLLWVYYGICLHGRVAEGSSGRKAAAYNALGLLVIGVAFIGVNFFFPGLHAYGR